jgi:hypothetical protein
MRTATRPAFLLTAAVLAGCLTASGCIPGVTWTPDSRGFYFTGGKDYQKILYYNVADRRARPVVADTGGATLWPAVSPDGQRVAVAVPAQHEGKDHFQVVVYDAKGKEVQRSRAVSLKPPAPDKDGQKAQGPPFWLFWAPRAQGDKVLLQLLHGCALFDLKEDRFTDLGDAVLWVFDNSPARPDGKGFLTLRPSAKKEDLQEAAAFYDWHGKRQPITGPGPEVLNLLAVPFLFASHWQGDVATVRGRGLELAVETDKLTTKMTKFAPERRGEEGRVVRQLYRFANDGAQVRVLELEDDPKKEIPLRVEVLPPGARTQVLAAKAAATTLFPSPDGKTLAVRFLTGGPGQYNAVRIVVLNAQGEVLADIDALKE